MMEFFLLTSKILKLDYRSFKKYICTSKIRLTSLKKFSNGCYVWNIHVSSKINNTDNNNKINNTNILW